MKAKLTAFAIVSLFAGGACAQSSVSIFGIMDMGYQYSWDNQASSTKNSSMVKAGGQDGSRFGLRGTEDLGNGLKANFEMAAGYDADSGQSYGGRLMSEGSWLGLSAERWGSLKAGYFATFLDDNTSIDASGRHGIASTGALYGTGKYQNFLAYYSPVFSGFQFKLGFSSNTGDQDQVPVQNASQLNVRAYTAALNYTAGALKLGAAYAAYEPQGVDTTTPSSTTSGYDWNAGVSYDFGVAAVSLFGARQKNGTPSTPVGSSSAYPDGAPNSVDRRDFIALGLAVPLGEKDTVKLGYGESRSHLPAAARDADARAFGIVYLHQLSKRTNTYVMYGNVHSDDNLYSVYSGYQQAINVGLRHLF